MASKDERDPPVPGRSSPLPSTAAFSHITLDGDMEEAIMVCAKIKRGRASEVTEAERRRAAELLGDILHYVRDLASGGPVNIRVRRIDYVVSFFHKQPSCLILEQRFTMERRHLGDRRHVEDRRHDPERAREGDRRSHKERRRSILRSIDLRCIPEVLFRSTTADT